MIEFKFPQQEEQFRRVLNLDDLRKKLKDAGESSNIREHIYRLAQPKDHYIYARCGKCQAKLKYRKDAQVFRLTHFNSFHSHSKTDRSENKIITDYIQNLPLSMKTSTVKALVKNYFRISDRKFYYLNRKCNRSRIDFSGLIQRLDIDKYQTRYSPYPLQKGMIPSIFLTSSPTMRANFMKYGQFTSVDVTYNLIRQKIDGRNWGICMFLGLNSHMHIIPFAISIINNQSEQSFSSLFLSFFQIMKAEPQTILSDEQLSIKSSLNKLKQNGSWSGEHLFDQFHILKNLKKKFKNHLILDFLKSAIFSESQEKFSIQIDKAKQIIENQRQAKLLSDFLQKSNKFSVSKSPQTFFGISINTSFTEKANDIIKSYIDYEKPAVECVTKLLKVMKILEDNSKNYKICQQHFQRLFNDSQLKQLRFRYCQRVFMVMLQAYIASLSYHPEQIHQNSWIFRLKNNKIQAEVVYKGLRFRCSCLIKQKKGFPCSHLFYCLKRFSENYEEYIHQRWLVEVDKQIKPISHRSGRPKLSRRNRL